MDVGDTSTTVIRLTGRATRLVLQPETADDTLVHLGVSASYVLSPNEHIRYSSRPESFLAPEARRHGQPRHQECVPIRPGARRQARPA